MLWKEGVLLVKRKPFECGTFEDKETAERYNEETKKRMKYLSRSFVSMTKKWGIVDGKVLDIGTGTGLLAIELAKKIPDVEVIGLDLSDVALKVARKNLQEIEHPFKVSFEKGDAEDTPFEDDRFDLVVSSNTLHLIKNPVRMFDEIQRVLKPSGKFFISDLRRSLLGMFSKHIRASYSPREIKEMLRRSMLQKWKVKDYFLWLSILTKE
jgi:ubiquinone/menaquinone biosynthesis C-methylase UbiE